MPASLSREINADIARFFWGKSDGSKGVHWTSVDKLCLPKLEGGLGFRDLHAFNISLLSKQSWRIINNPDALWVKILKARYFPHCSLYDAVKGSRASWVWNSILKGREAIITNARWQVHNGKKIDVWRDAWVPGIEGGKVIPTTLNNRFTALSVSKLIDEDTGEWNINPIIPFITEKDAKAITSIPLCNRLDEDRIVWPLERNGCFSVRSTYRYVFKGSRAHLDRATTSRFVTPELWKKCWKIKTPLKVNMFFWKALNYALPVLGNLVRRKMSTVASCKLCGAEEETVEHFLFLCPWAKCTWFGSALGFCFDPQGVTTIDDWLYGYLSAPIPTDRKVWFQTYLLVLLW